MTRSTLFCDFDGPIADVSERYYLTYCRGLEHMQAMAVAAGNEIAIRSLSKAQFWTFKQNRVPDRQIAHWSGLEGTQIDEFLDLVSTLVNHPSLLAYDQVQGNAYEALSILQQCDVRVVLVTLRPPDQVIQFLAQHGLEGLISDLYGMPTATAAYQNQAQHKIERLRVAMAAQQRQGYSLQNTWMIGDTEADIMAGQALGIDTVALTCGIRSHSYLQSFRPTHLMPNLWTAAQCFQQQVTLGRR